jgi:hypothetical protein
MSILTYLVLPDTRSVAYEHLGDIDATFGRSSFDLLRRLGITKDDVPAMVQALDKIDGFYQGRTDIVVPTDAYYDGETAESIMRALGEFGPEAREALPTLERMAAGERVPMPAFQEPAKQAIEKIKPPSTR